MEREPTSRPGGTDVAGPDGRDRDPFADYDGPIATPRATTTRASLLRPVTMRAFAALVGGIVLLFSDRSTTTLAVVLGGVLIAVALAGLRSRGQGAVSRWGTATVTAAGGIVLLVWPDVTGPVIAGVVAIGLVAAGLRDVIRGGRIRTTDAGRARWWQLRGVFLAVVGGATWAAPDALLNVVIALIAVAWVVTGVAAVLASLMEGEGSAEISDVWLRFFSWVEQRPQTVDDRAQLYGKVFFEGREGPRRLSRFLLLMAFATLIAAFGIVGDSTAVVIGAMLVAPLMTPLMGTSLSLAMGWPKRAVMSAGVALSGIVLAVGLSALVAGMLPFEIQAATNSQVASRVAPTLVDLMIAMAAGGAGAFAMSRPDVSDALPGVAVAIALVPPLSVVGLMLASVELDEALGALLLFVTNLVAILIVGAVVFVLTGVVPVAVLAKQRHRVRASALMVGAVAVVVVALLGITGQRIRAQAFDRDAVQRAVDAWVGDRSLEVVSIAVTPTEIEVVVVGSDRPGSLRMLARELEARLERESAVVARRIFEERLEFQPSGD